MHENTFCISEETHEEVYMQIKPQTSLLIFSTSDLICSVFLFNLIRAAAIAERSKWIVFNVALCLSPFVFMIHSVNLILAFGVLYFLGELHLLVIVILDFIFTLFPLCIATTAQQFPSSRRPVLQILFRC